jgi:hypothetical protein
MTVRVGLLPPARRPRTTEGIIMSDVLDELLSSRKSEIQETVFNGLRHVSTPHYRTMDEGLLRERAASLVAAFSESIRGNPADFTAYLQKITDTRIAEGVPLHEIQIALRTLEQEIWDLVIGHVPASEQVRCLGVVTRTIGEAKDRMAGFYLGRLEKAETRAADLEHRLERLAAGTDPAPFEETGFPG